jgi:hypothetical protein
MIRKVQKWIQDNINAVYKVYSSTLIKEATCFSVG